MGLVPLLNLETGKIDRQTLLIPVQGRYIMSSSWTLWSESFLLEADRVP